MTSGTLVTLELDLLLEVVAEVQLLLQHVSILEKRINENLAMGHPEVSSDTFIFGTSRCCSDTCLAVGALQFPQFHTPEFRCQGLCLDTAGGPLCP